MPRKRVLCDWISPEGYLDGYKLFSEFFNRLIYFGIFRFGTDNMNSILKLQSEVRQLSITSLSLKSEETVTASRLGIKDAIWVSWFVAVVFLIILWPDGRGISADRLTVTAPIANIRSGPGTKYDIIWKVEKYHPLLILKKSGAWYHFRDFEGDEGWVHHSLVGKLPAVITKKDKCNIRSGPGTRQQVVFMVEKGIPFKVLRRKGNWINIQHADGEKGWIHKSLVW